MMDEATMLQFIAHMSYAGKRFTNKHRNVTRRDIVHAIAVFSEYIQEVYTDLEFDEMMGETYGRAAE